MAVNTWPFYFIVKEEKQIQSHKPIAIYQHHSDGVKLYAIPIEMLITQSKVNIKIGGKNKHCFLQSLKK